MLRIADAFPAVADVVSDYDSLRQLLLPAGAVSASLLLLIRCWQRRRRSPLPPGPSGLPLIGCLPLLASGDRQKRVAELFEKYNSEIVSFPVGGRLFVFVNGYEAVKRLLEDEAFLDRPKAPSLTRVTEDCGMLFSRGQVWAHNRRTTLRILRDFGFARTRSGEMIDRQFDVIQEFLDESVASGESIKTLGIFLESTNTIIANFTIGRTFSRNDPEFVYVNDALKRTFSSPPFLNLPLLFPSTDWLLQRIPACRRFERLQLDLNDFILKQVKLREKVAAENSEPECLTDALLTLKAEAEKKGDFETYKYMQIVRLNLEFFLAGTDTTARSLEWLMIHMAFHPEVQRRVQNELDSVVGQSRRPQAQDRRQLAFTCATIEESFRIVSLVGMGIPRMPVKDQEFAGHFIPGGSFVFPFVYGVNHSRQVWGDPESYRPDRFLDNDGGFAGAGKSIPFMIGRRSCAGESLSRMETFLIFAGIMQRYFVEVDDEFKDKKEEVLAGKQEQFREPGDCRLRFRLRQ